MPHKQPIDLDAHKAGLLTILTAMTADPKFAGPRIDRLVQKLGRLPGGHFYSRDDLIRAYRAFAGVDLPPYDASIIGRLRMKPIRSSSGVTPVTILTKPFPCPGECIFCPNDVRMPKSYLADEPGAQRAGQNAFDPYLQTMTRLRAFYNTGHPTDKIEVLILGGTWSFYPETYQIWFVKRVFDALHDFGAGVDHSDDVWRAIRADSQFDPARQQTEIRLHGAVLEQTYNQTVQSVYAGEMRRSRDIAGLIASGAPRRPTDEFATWDELEAAQRINETAACRCVGLVVETRPDHISLDEVLRVRRLGCTKVQIGFQTLNDGVLSLNRRGHDVAATSRAVKLLRQGGFKIHAHWMPNLYGATVESDLADYARLFADPDFRPDELKIYPCSLIESAELMRHYQSGAWRPYTHAELLHLLTECFLLTPEYCRLTRVIRDIPGTDIVDGNKVTNFRQLVDNELTRTGRASMDIRAREVRFRSVETADLTLDETCYATSTGEEIFLQFVTPERAIAGFLRLSLPASSGGIPELAGAAIIREVHIYGQSVDLGESTPGAAQHHGLGTRLIARAAEIASEVGFARLSVISAVGTRPYYRNRGFVDGSLYQTRVL